jgi:membrane peptidoglycan carboxypeptidase
MTGNSSWQPQVIERRYFAEVVDDGPKHEGGMVGTRRRTSGRGYHQRRPSGKTGTTNDGNDVWFISG